MNKRLTTLAGALLLLPVFAHADCDSVKSMIHDKIQAAGVQQFSLAVVAQDAPPTDGKVVGTCEGDKQIVYTKGGSPTDSDTMGSSDSSSSSSSSSNSSSGSMSDDDHGGLSQPAPTSSSSGD